MARALQLSLITGARVLPIAIVACLILIPVSLLLRWSSAGTQTVTVQPLGNHFSVEVPADQSAAARDARQLGLERVGKHAVSRVELVSAMPSDPWHQDIVHGSRAWRKVRSRMKHGTAFCACSECRHCAVCSLLVPLVVAPAVLCM